MREGVSELIALNEQLRAGTMFYNHPGRNNSEDIYINIERFGFARADVFILSLLPDGNDTIIGSFMNRDRKFYYFDINLDNYNYSVLCEGAPPLDRNRLFPQYIANAADRWFKGTDTESR